MSRRIIIGDIHGNYQGVERLLSSINYKFSEDILIFAGDYNDHLELPDYSTRKTIDLLINLKEKSDNVYFVLGNHDLWMREWFINRGIPHPIWIKQGARETFKSYGILNLRDAESKINNIPQSHRDFYVDNIQDYYIDDEVIVVHGGFTNQGQMNAVSKGKKMEYEQIYQIIWDRRFIFSKLKEENIQFKKYFGNRYLVVGHTPYGPYTSEINKKWILVDGNSKAGKPQLGVILNDGEYSFIVEDK